MQSWEDWDFCISILCWVITHNTYRNIVRFSEHPLCITVLMMLKLFPEILSTASAPQAVASSSDLGSAVAASRASNKQYAGVPRTVRAPPPKWVVIYPLVVKTWPDGKSTNSVRWFFLLYHTSIHVEDFPASHFCCIRGYISDWLLIEYRLIYPQSSMRDSRSISSIRISCWWTPTIISNVVRGCFPLKRHWVGCSMAHVRPSLVIRRNTKSWSQGLARTRAQI